MYGYVIIYYVLQFAGIYLTVVMALTSISVIMTVMVLNLHFRGPNDALVPGWLRFLFLGRGRIKGLKVNRSRDSKYVEKYMSDNNFRFRQSSSLRDTIENLAQELKEDQYEPCSAARQHNTGRSREKADDFYDSNIISEENETNQRHGTNYYPQPDFSAARRFAYQGMKSNTDILNHMKKIIDRYEKEDSQDDLLFQWKQVAVAVDKILFCIFLFATASATVVILIVAPITKFI